MARLRRERAEWRRLGGGGGGESSSSDAAAPLLLRSAEVRVFSILKLGFVKYAKRAIGCDATPDTDGYRMTSYNAIPLQKPQVHLAALLRDYQSTNATLSGCIDAADAARGHLDGSKRLAQKTARALNRVEGVVRSMALAREGAHRRVRAPVW